MRGDKPDPTATRTESTMPKPPADLSAAERDRWDWWARRLAGAALLIPLDAALLRALIGAELLARAADAAIAKDGAFYSIESGLRKAHPAVKVSLDARATIRQILAELNLTPARRGAKPVTPSEPDEFEQYLRNKFAD